MFQFQVFVENVPSTSTHKGCMNILVIFFNYCWFIFLGKPSWKCNTFDSFGKKNTNWSKFRFSWCTYLNMHREVNVTKFWILVESLYKLKQSVNQKLRPKVSNPVTEAKEKYYNSKRLLMEKELEVLQRKGARDEEYHQKKLHF